MALVEGEDARCLIALSEDHERGVGDTDVLIFVTRHDRPREAQIVNVDLREVPGRTRKLIKRGKLSVYATSTRQQIVKLGDNKRRDYEGPDVSVARLAHPIVMVIAPVEVRE